MSQTLVQINKLQKYIKDCGEDKMVLMTLFKLFNYKVQIYEKHIKELTFAIKEYEQRYNMDSDNFYQAFKAGTIGDAMDFVDWASMHQMRTRLIIRKHLLEK